MCRMCLALDAIAKLWAIMLTPEQFEHMLPVLLHVAGRGGNISAHFSIELDFQGTDAGVDLRYR